MNARTMTRTRRAPTTKRKKKRGHPKPQSLLILHLDADRLRRDGLHLREAAQFGAIVAALGMGADVAATDATDTASLLRAFADLAEKKKTFDVVVAIGHSHAGGIRVASDHDGVTPWHVFANYLRPFHPRRLLLVACKAGRWDAGDALFNGLPKLRRIYACPVNATRDFGALMLFAVPYVVAERRPKNKIVTWAQAASVALTGRQLRQWLRTTDNGNPDSAVLDVIAEVLDPVAKEIPAALRRFFR